MGKNFPFFIGLTENIQGRSWSWRGIEIRKVEQESNFRIKDRQVPVFFLPDQLDSDVRIEWAMFQQAANKIQQILNFLKVASKKPDKTRTYMYFIVHCTVSTDTAIPYDFVFCSWCRYRIDWLFQQAILNFYQNIKKLHIKAHTGTYPTFSKTGLRIRISQIRIRPLYLGKIF